jgi:CrcB protein
MSAWTYAAIAAAGGLASVGRFLVDAAVSARAARGLPTGTLVVNLSGAFVLGFLSGRALSGDALAIAGTGVLGSYTTFSTWMFESQRLAEDGRGRAAAANLVVSLAAGIAVAALGRALGELL